MLRRAFQMLVLSPLIALAMLARPMFASPAIDPSRFTHKRGASARNPRKPGRLYTPNGKRECARRRRQIELGQLRVSA